MEYKELLIERKKAEIAKHEGFIKKNYTWVYILGIILGGIVMFIGVPMLINDNEIGAAFFGLGASLMFIIAVFYAIYWSRRKKAPLNIAKLNSQIKELTDEVKTENGAKTKVEESDSVDMLLKYKQLYDNGIISEEEYNAKKKELLK